jgi:micrococcal nuclease
MTLLTIAPAPGAEAAASTPLFMILATILLAAMLVHRTPPATASEPGPPTLSGVVLRAVDGETIEVRVGDRIEAVRYIGVRTPVIPHPTKSGAFRAQAAAANATLVVVGQEATLEPGIMPRDNAGRLLAFVYANGRFINAELVRRGFAEVVTIPPNVQRRHEFLALQIEAQRARVGLWADDDARRFYGPARSGVVGSARTMSFFHVDDTQRSFDGEREYFETPEAAVRAGYSASFNYPVLDEDEWRNRRAAVGVPEPTLRPMPVVVTPPAGPPQPVGHLWRGGVLTPIWR